MATCDGAKPFVVHLIRAANRWVTYKDRKQVSAALKDVYTATDEEEAKKALDDFAASDLGHKYPQSVKVWEDAWDMICSISAVPTSDKEG